MRKGEGAYVDTWVIKLSINLGDSEKYREGKLNKVTRMCGEREHERFSIVKKEKRGDGSNSLPIA